MNSPLYIAVDLGAGSGRIFLGGFDDYEFLLDEVHRFRYPPYSDGQYLRWNFGQIFDEVIAGLSLAIASARNRRVASLGVDSWAVDYGLISTDGRLIGDPICYRDSRTDEVMNRVFAIIPRDEIFKRTGIQFQKFNTLYQLFAEREKNNASTLLLLPDLFNYLLTGKAAAEYTNATTTQMMNARTGDWDADLIDRLSLPRNLLQTIVPAGTRLGNLLPEIAEETSLQDIEVIAPATHDTASAVAAAPLAEGSAYISSGTWSLIGVERDSPLITRDASQLNFTNEGGVYETFRFLKNVMGLWIFESCRKEWESSGMPVDYGSLIGRAESIDRVPGFIFPDDERFLNPTSMLDAISKQLSETGQEPVSDPAIITKIIFDSLAFRYASVLRSIELLTGTKLKRVEIVGGGGRNRYLNQMTANASGLPSRSGLAEATVVGNLIVQAITAGRFASLAEGREYIASKIEFEEYAPHSTPEIDEAAARYRVIEERFANAVARAGDGL